MFLSSFSSLLHSAASRAAGARYFRDLHPGLQIKTLKVLSEGLFKYKDLINV